MPASPILAPTRGRQILAWLVHAYTAMGLVCAAGMAVAIFEGTPASFRLAFVLMVVACAIDATDGTFARLVRVKQVLPSFDGARLDDITDFLTYTFLPLLLIWRADLVPADHAWLLLVPLIASAYGFCQTMAKTPDGHFLGFPSYWNVVAFYLYVLRPPFWLTETILIVLAVLTFVPLRYLYPSQKGLLNRVMLVLVAVWGLLLCWMLSILPSDRVPSMIEDTRLQTVTWISLIVPACYMAVSWAESWRVMRRKAGGQADWDGHWD